MRAAARSEAAASCPPPPRPPRSRSPTLPGASAPARLLPQRVAQPHGVPSSRLGQQLERVGPLQEPGPGPPSPLCTLLSIARSVCRRERPAAEVGVLQGGESKCVRPARCLCSRSQASSNAVTLRITQIEPQGASKAQRQAPARRRFQRCAACGGLQQPGSALQALLWRPVSPARLLEGVGTETALGAASPRPCCPSDPGSCCRRLRDRRQLGAQSWRRAKPAPSAQRSRRRADRRSPPARRCRQLTADHHAGRLASQAGHSGGQLQDAAEGAVRPVSCSAGRALLGLPSSCC